MPDTPKTTRELAMRCRGTCDCGTVLKRIARPGPATEMFEVAVYCDGCDSFFKRVRCFDNESLEFLQDIPNIDLGRLR